MAVTIKSEREIQLMREAGNSCESSRRTCTGSKSRNDILSDR